MDDGARFATLFNQWEAGLWMLIAVVIAAKLLRRPAGRLYWSLPPAFVVFGISDIIESRTGAFWDPWWLLVMKGGCVVVFVFVGIGYERDRQKRRTTETAE